MNKKTKQTLFFLTLAFVAGMWIMYWLNPKINSSYTPAIEKQVETVSPKKENKVSTNFQPENPSESIEQLTQQDVVIDYLKVHKKLPDYYIKKNDAKIQGWIPSKGNLCDAVPGRAIGGDNFSNREKRLPIKKGRKYFEADINYNCGRRGADRLVYSNDGLIFITKDHYSSFKQR
ncbi:MAG: ribonuclease domain-containing protein [Weeksellaceae bacterium]